MDSSETGSLGHGRWLQFPITVAGNIEALSYSINELQLSSAPPVSKLLLEMVS